MLTATTEHSAIEFQQHFMEADDDTRTILQGLKKNQKTLNPKYFYDTRGSELFEKITQTQAYYPTRTERKILTTYKSEIGQMCGESSVIIEPGSGSSEKIKLLLNTLKPKAYIPIDIAADFLKQSAAKLYQDFPWLQIKALCADFNQLTNPPSNLPNGKRIIFYPGSTIGNMSPEEAKRFLSVLHDWTSPNGGVILGVDTYKATDRLNQAYNDPEGITADFNLNILHHINRIANASFNPDNFSHKAYFNEQSSRIEMHLVSRLDHIVRVADQSIVFHRGETIHTENSYKYKDEAFKSLAQAAGFKVQKTWKDQDGLFSVHYLSAS